MTQQATTGTTTSTSTRRNTRTRAGFATATTGTQAAKLQIATSEAAADEAAVPEIAAPTLRLVDPATLVTGTNVRLDTRLDAQFVASIKARGVLLQPIVAVETAAGTQDGTHLGSLTVRYGQRRTLAAVQAGRMSVPVLVVPDSDDAQRLIEQMAENDHRAELTQSERFAGLEQLAALRLCGADR